MNDNLKNAYLYFRTPRGHYRGTVPAVKAIENARADVAAGNRRHARCASSASEPYNIGSTRVRYYSDYRAFGFRFVGFADEVAPRRVEHYGWYTRADGFESGETLRGAVFLLPGRDGHARAYAGYMEQGFGEDGAAIIACRMSETVCCRGADYGVDKSEFADTAGEADSIAERAAEDDREHDTAWQAGALYAANLERAREARKEARDVARAARDNVKNNPVICATLRDKVRALRDEARELFKECRALRAGDYNEGHRYLGFYTGDEKLREAFNDGAGAEVLQ